VARANLGFAGQQRPLDRRLARTHQLSTLQAVEIVAVEARGPASRAGLWEGDLLVAVNGRPVGTVDDVHRMLVAWPIGEPLTGGDTLREELTGPALAEPGHEGRETVCMGLRRPDRSLTPRC
jgi:S1-C subfamily serine protease